MSTCNQPCFTENGRVHDFCCKSHADEYHTWGFHGKIIEGNYLLISFCFPTASSHQPIQSHGYFTRRSTGPIHFYNRDELYYEFTNFALYRVMIDDKVWPTTEHYFQAQKFIGTPYMELIRRLPAPRLAFDFSRKPEVSHWRRNDWEQVKEKVMEKALWAKFTQHPVLYKMLLDTGNRRLVEHTSNDRYWGDGGDGSGKNRLGNLLMDVRQKLRQGNTSPPFSSQHVHVIEIHGNHPLHHEQLQGTSSTDLQLYKDGCDSQHSSSENLMSFDDSKLCNNTVFNSSDQHQLVTERILDSQQTAENSTNILQPLTASADYSTSVPPQPNSDQSTNTIDPTSIFIDASPGGGTGTIISSAEVLTNQSDPVTTTKPDTTLAGGKVQEDDTSTPMEVDENKIN